ncbi:U3 small nucleolar RNA-associated protein 25 [Parastagonospora nodorum]|nr:U3 small nucleolar RNA-associated protein 25 [Parastagonospora nodorum]KAH4358551.1 U3 small nucleolar RNA-associated protein 25 [Parastagonospora nodorum]KAH4373458.1 U3 small nucleolar RNA-associated protein 25 [Parastagonospora nodorum]KAH4799587.1 U3 small nucleolar RNA-associated protein 25 [Parastagonospora nodorum]KAH4893549.1 U3 small nucleolar RNA-associated protein 25 [Parastagonospora nodorum]
MAPTRGRGGFRARGRGGARGGGKGRGRGRGGPRGGARGGFAAPRMRDEVEDAASDMQHAPEPGESQSEDSDDSVSDNDDDEEDAQPTSNAYAALLQSLSTVAKQNEHQETHRRKKRKLAGEDLQVAEEPQQKINRNMSNLTEDEPDAVFDGDALDEDPQEDAASDDGVQIRDAVEETQDGFESFEVHFANPDENDLAMRLRRISENQWSAKKLDAAGGRALLQVPCADNTAFDTRKLRSTRDVQLKARLAENAQKVVGQFNDGHEQVIMPSIFGYQDVLFAARTVHNAARMRDITCLHALNHILIGRDRVLKNNAKLAAANDGDDVEYRDQGFTRPKVLFLLETKQACVRVVDSITRLFTFEQQENKKRFLDQFHRPDQAFSDDKPADFRELFEGNDENEFRVGVKLTRKTLKFYSTFYNSDIIFASPLGLRRAIETGDPKKRSGDYDFLSSIEMVIMEQADANLMQNWEHAEFVFEHLNLQPKESHGCDFSRVRPWYLDDNAKHVRQTIVMSAFLTPKINTLWNKHMRNFFGRLKYTPDYSAGVIESLSHGIKGIKQTFLRFESPSHLTDPDARFKYFSSTILPSILRTPKPAEGGPGILMFVPSYLDFTRLRNSLVDVNISYALISEYTDMTDVRKARSHFMNGKHSLLLYSGRAHHFHRFNIRGVKRVVFYGVPENPIFYEELVSMVGKSVERGETSRAEASIRVMFSKWERMELERIVGTKRLSRMVGDKGDVFDFVY